jgi:hypothetical protein
MPELTTVDVETVLDPLNDYFWFNDTSEAPDALNRVLARYLREVELLITVGDETTNLSTGTAKVTFRMPYAMTVTDVRASVNTAPIGSTIIVDINEAGVSILSTKLSIDASEKTSTTAATPAVISDTALVDDAEMTIDIDQVGSGTPGKGLKIWIKGYKS